jgi:hypothetical protein
MGKFCHAYFSSKRTTFIADLLPETATLLFLPTGNFQRL